MSEDKPKHYSVIGSGQYNYDIISVREYPNGFELGKRNEFKDNVVKEEIGGIGGNVMCMLSFLGWKAMPQAQFIDTDEGLRCTRSLEDFGCDTRYVENIPGGGLSILRCTHHRHKKTGMHDLGLRRLGHNGSRFAKVKQLRARDEVRALVQRMELVPDVYFFDTMEAGPRALAASLKDKGALIYFEAECNKDINKFQASVKVADIVKLSNENVPDTDFVTSYRDKLFIQTLAGEGMRFSLRGAHWVHIPLVKVEEVVDWEGCGDTTTAVFLDELSKIGLPSVSELTAEQVRVALEKAAAKAAECTQYIGSKGWMQK